MMIKYLEAIPGLNELRVVVWQNFDSKYEWFLAYVKYVDDDIYTVGHLHWLTLNWLFH